MEGNQHGSDSLQETMRSLGEGQQRLSATLEWMVEHLQNQLAHEIAEILHAKGPLCGRQDDDSTGLPSLKGAALAKKDRDSRSTFFSDSSEPLTPHSARSAPTVSHGPQDNPGQLGRQISPGQPRRQISPGRQYSSRTPRRQISAQSRRQISTGVRPITPRRARGIETVAESPNLTAADPASPRSTPDSSHIKTVSGPGTVVDKLPDDVQRVSPRLSQFGATRGTTSSVNLLKYAPTNSLSQRCQKLAMNSHFQGGCAVMILVNCLLLGVSAEHAVDHDYELGWVTGANYFCAFFFLVELLIRIVAFGRSFFSGDERRWNIFDFILVLQSVVDYALEEVSGGQGVMGMSAMKTLKLLRIARVIRFFRFFRELSLMVLMVANSLKSLTWVLLLLFLMMYTFAIFFTQICTDSIKANPDGRHASVAREQFGTVARTIYSLILSILGGISWGEICDTLISIGFAPAALFLFYISFATLAVLNIITGVFVENAVEVAKTRKDVMTEKADQQREGIVAELRNLFYEIDDDESGFISYSEMAGAWSNKSVRACFASLGLDLFDMERLYLLIDEDATGEIEIDDFLGGCLKFRGEARSLDVHAVLREIKRVDRRLEDQELRLKEGGGPWSKAEFSEMLKMHTMSITGHMSITSKQTEDTVAKWGQRIDHLKKLIDLNGPAQENGHALSKLAVVSSAFLVDPSANGARNNSTQPVQEHEHAWSMPGNASLTAM